MKPGATARPAASMVLLCLFLYSFFNGKNLSIQDPDVGPPGRRAGAVEDEAVLDEQVEGHGLRCSLPLSKWGRFERHIIGGASCSA